MNESRDRTATGNAGAAKRPAGWSRLWMLFAVILAAQLPFLMLHFKELWKEPHYQYFPVVIGVVAYLLWVRWHESSDGEIQLSGEADRAWPFIALETLALVVLAGAVFLYSPWLAALAAILALAGFAYKVRGRRRVANVIGIWCLLWLVLPIPMGFDRDLVLGLQRISTTVSSRVLDLGGSLHAMDGNVLVFPHKEFFVDEACSGIMSLMAMIAASAVTGVWRNRSFLHVVLLILAGVAWAGLMNVIRIVLIVFCYFTLGIDLSAGWQHEVTGLILFGMGFLAVLSTDSLMAFLLGSIDREKTNPLVRCWNRVTGFATPRTAGGIYRSQAGSVRHSAVPRWLYLYAAMFAVLGAVELAGVLNLVHLGPGKRSREVVSEVDVPATLPRTAIQAHDPNWELTAYEIEERDRISIFGENSVVWSFDGPKYAIYVSVDYPFYKWHELTDCYRSRGWKITSRETNEEEGWTTVQADLTRESGEKALVMYGLFRAGGEPLAPPPQTIGEKIRFRLMGLSAAQQRGGPVYQVQVWIPDSSGLDEVGRENLIRGFSKWRGEVRDKLTQGAKTR